MAQTAVDANCQPGPERILAWIRLSQIPSFGPILIKKAVAALGSPEALLNAHPTRMALIPDIGPKRAEAFARAVPASSEIAQQILDQAHAANISILTPDHANWPPGLKNIVDPPIVLFVRGQVIPQDTLAIAIVGSRRCTLYGREQSERFGALLAGSGITVISGGARGIDTAAHEGALRANGRTIVVQGCGLLHCYPAENVELYNRVTADHGAIISELPLDAPPLPEQFPPRNRIIAALSLGVLVVEANQRSGSLITARLAADDYGREVFALPGRVDSPASAGTHHLIKTASAKLVENLQDILDGLGDVGAALAKQTAATSGPPISDSPAGIAPNKSGADESPLSLFDAPEISTTNPAPNTPSPPIAAAAAPAIALPFTAAQQKILAAFSDAGTEASVDQLCDATALPPAVLMAELTFLQIRGAIKRSANQRFSLNRVKK